MVPGGKSLQEEPVHLPTFLSLSDVSPVETGRSAVVGLRGSGPLNRPRSAGERVVSGRDVGRSPMNRSSCPRPHHVPLPQVLRTQTRRGHSGVGVWRDPSSDPTRPPQTPRGTDGWWLSEVTGDRSERLILTPVERGIPGQVCDGGSDQWDSGVSSAPPRPPDVFRTYISVRHGPLPMLAAVQPGPGTTPIPPVLTTGVRKCRGGSPGPGSLGVLLPS